MYLVKVQPIQHIPLKYPRLARVSSIAAEFRLSGHTYFKNKYRTSCKWFVVFKRLWNGSVNFYRMDKCFILRLSWV